LARLAAGVYVKQREALGHPLLAAAAGATAAAAATAPAGSGEAGRG
jgi:hypothetical protein